MTTTQPSQWRQRARVLGLDPQEIKSVSSRYDMYKQYTDAQDGAETLNLTRWYKWYRVEKLSEGHAMTTPPAQDCSIGPETSAEGPVISEPEFLQLLMQYRGHN
jgi:hypothetical protein